MDLCIFQADLLFLTPKATRSNAGFKVAGWQGGDSKVAGSVGSGFEERSCIEARNRDCSSSYRGAHRVSHCALNAGGVRLSDGRQHEQQERACG
jgi:hypothetical protein